MKKIIILTATLLICSLGQLSAQQKDSNKLDNQVNLVFGVSQIALGGFNIEGNIFWNRFAFDYSHGASLNMTNDALEAGLDKDNGLSIHIPWTTGFGVGYRFNNWLNLRVEPKWHQFELYFDGDEQITSNMISEYNTFTLGLGIYANLRPFKNQNNFLKGIMIAPNARWWPRVSSTLENNELSFDLPSSDASAVHTARQIGIANTAFFVNMSVGYSVAF